MQKPSELYVARAVSEFRSGIPQKDIIEFRGPSFRRIASSRAAGITAWSCFVLRSLKLSVLEKPQKRRRRRRSWNLSKPACVCGQPAATPVVLESSHDKRGRWLGKEEDSSSFVALTVRVELMMKDLASLQIFAAAYFTSEPHLRSQWTHNPS